MSDPFTWELQRTRDAWDANRNGFILASSPGGKVTHWPSCHYIGSTLRVADALWRGKSQEEAGGNVSFPRWVAGSTPTCRICREVGQA